MGHSLVRELLDGAPPEWGRPERLVALVIADDANDRTRRSWIPIEGRWRPNGRWQDGLCERTGLSPRSVRAALHQLGRRGYEMRRSIGTGKDGRPVYAARGHSTDFYVPGIAARPEPQRQQDPTAFDDRKAAGFGQKGGRNLPERRQDPTAPLLMSPQISLSPRAQLVGDRLAEATTQERETIVKRIEDLGPKNFAAYVRSIPDADLEAMLSEVRRQGAPAPAPQKRPWCGTCDETTRIQELPDSTARRCPRCHPHAAAPAADRQSQGGLP